MKHLARIVIASLSAMVGACGADSNTPTEPSQTPGSPQTGTRIVRETLTGSMSATTSATCSPAFRASVDMSYFLGGTGRCVEFPRRSTTAGIITAGLQWQERRIDLDLVLNDRVGMNYRQSIAANRSGEKVEFFVNGGTDYAFVVYLRGVDAQFVANGGVYFGEVATPFTLEVERPE